MSTSPIPVVLVQGDVWSGVALCRRDNGNLLFNNITTPPITVNGQGDYIDGSRGAIVREGTNPNFWIFVQDFVGDAPLKLTRVVVTPPVITTSAPPAPVETFPDLPGLAWEVHLEDEFRTLIQRSNAPGYEARISKGPDAVTHIRMHFNFLRQNFKGQYDAPAVLTETTPMGVSVTDVTLAGIGNFSRQSARWALDSTIIFAAGLSVYKLDPVLGTASALYTEPGGDVPYSDGELLRISNISNGRILAYTIGHIYELDATSLAVVNTWAASAFGLDAQIQRCVYDQSSRTSWAIAQKTGVSGLAVYKLNLNAMASVALTAVNTSYYSSARMAMNDVANRIGIVSPLFSDVFTVINTITDAVATDTLPYLSNFAVDADDDGYFWAADGHAADIGTPSWKIDPNSLAVVLTVGVPESGFAPSHVPRAQDYGFASVVPTIVGPLTYPITVADDELAIVRGFWRSKQGDAISFSLPISKLTKNLADPTVQVRFEKGGADFKAFLYELYELQELSFVTVAGP